MVELATGMLEDAGDYQEVEIAVMALLGVGAFDPDQVPAELIFSIDPQLRQFLSDAMLAARAEMWLMER